MLKRAFQLLGLFISIAVASGCVMESGSCGNESLEPIEEFEVTISTGEEPCDCDVKFCFKRHSSHDWECALLDRDWYDDFEAWETGTYYVVPHPAVAAGDLETFEIVNTNCSFLNSILSISWLEIYAFDYYGDATMLYEASFEPYEEFWEGEALVPDSCHF